jgi:hypothetical protein
MKSASTAPGPPAETSEPPTQPTPELPDLSHWHTAIAAIPEGPDGPSPLRGVPHGSESKALKGRSLADLGHGNGRPTWWLPEPATGNLMAGWDRWPIFALRFTPEYLCDHVYVRGTNEPDLCWGVQILGNATHRSVKDVISWLGLPNSRSGDGRYELLQWQCPGYYVALRFGPHGKCLGITSSSWPTPQMRPQQ